jgi:hypothetical protein
LNVVSVALAQVEIAPGDDELVAKRQGLRHDFAGGRNDAQL